MKKTCKNVTFYGFLAPPRVHHTMRHIPYIGWVSGRCFQHAKDLGPGWHLGKHVVTSAGLNFLLPDCSPMQTQSSQKHVGASSCSLPWLCWSTLALRFRFWGQVGCVKVDCIPEGIWPKGQVDGGRPSLLCMEELLPCALTEAVDGLFWNAILEVSVDPTKGKSLPFGTAFVLEGIVCTLSIVAVIVEDADTTLLGKVLECLLGFNDLYWGGLVHQVDVLELGAVINKDCDCSVLFLGEWSFELGNETHLCWNQLIHTNTLPCFCCHKHLMVEGGHLSFLRNLSHGTKEA